MGRRKKLRKKKRKQYRAIEDLVDALSRLTGTKKKTKLIKKLTRIWWKTTLATGQDGDCDADCGEGDCDFSVEHRGWENRPCSGSSPT